MLDIRITGGTLIDGTGTEGRPADIGIRDGLIVDEWDVFDTLSFLAQLGIVERPK